MNPLYKDVHIDETWESVSKENDLSLWKMLTNENAEDDELQKDIDDDYNAQENAEVRIKVKIVQWQEILRHPTLLLNIEGPSILLEEAVNIAPGEGQIPVYHSNEENMEIFAFPKLYYYGEQDKVYNGLQYILFNEKKHIMIMIESSKNILIRIYFPIYPPISRYEIKKYFLKIPLMV